MSIVKILPVHLGILLNAPLARLATDQRSPHGAGDNATNGYDNGRCEHEVRPKRHVGYEEEDVDEKTEKGEDECQDAENEHPQQIPGRVRGRVKVRRCGEDKHDEREEGGDGVDYEDRREGRSGALRKVESPRLRG